MKDTLHIRLIDEQKVSVEEVVNSLLSQKSGTKWAEKTNGWAIEYVQHLGGVYGDTWYQGSLPQEFFPQILLPQHGHQYHEEKSFFPLDASIKDAVEFFKHPTPEAAECAELIKYLKEEIRNNGFTSSVIVAVINGTLKHVDGLHRMIALAMLLEEGFQYPTISVYLCDNTR